MTIGMAFDAAGGRPMFDLRSGALAVKVDFSFLRAKLVPLGAAVLAIAAFAAGSAYADLYRVRKAEKVLSERFAAESADLPGPGPHTVESVLESTAASGAGQASPIPRLSAYDLLLDISAHIPPKDKITLDLDSVNIDEGKVDISGTTKKVEEIDTLISELRKIECFKNNITRGATDNQSNGVRFKLTITAQCMGAS
jgi:general secretion pathway protein L